VHIQLIIHAATSRQKYKQSKLNDLCESASDLQAIFLSPKSKEKYVFFAGLLQILFPFEGLKKCYI